MVSVTAFFCVTVWITAAPSASADQYHEQITKAFPGFKILARSEFTEEIQQTVKTNPALVTGRFNNDEIEDFAAIIRSGTKQRHEHGAEYYPGMDVVCHGLGKRQYQCRVLGQGAYFLPHPWYLYRVESGEFKTGDFPCYNESGDQIAFDDKREAIGYVFPDKGGGFYSYHSDGSYLNCAGH